VAGEDRYVKDWWPFMLRPSGSDALGELLAKHPDAADRTKRLTDGLTVMKLIKIANAEYNYCRLGRDIPVDLEMLARSDLAWRRLDSKSRTIAMRSGTAWMRTADVLATGSDEGLASTRSLSISRLIVVCERLIKGPYRDMTKSGGLTRW
jgi:hypothetical protein